MSNDIRSNPAGSVAGALLWPLEQGLGDAWNDEQKMAWTAIYTVIASTMVDAAKQNAA
jgi:hemoglobin-like flavoprotein